MGSWPRPQELLRAFRRNAASSAGQEFDGVADRAVIAALRAQEEAGADLVTDGEQRRDNFYSFVAEKLDGVQMMTLVRDARRRGGQAGLRAPPGDARRARLLIRNPTCVGPIRPPRSSSRSTISSSCAGIPIEPIKVTLPGPYLLTRAMWVKEVSREVYPTKEDLGEDVVRLLGEEVRDLTDAGVDVHPAGTSRC